ncbi:hypothetical protein VTN49DRAFT_5065 [Thermomyces lanuginosus]|uniref:uncharacterized protein n=1 Tax=Thermomyces lanuginosus TaxID=5541 RepID=UPI003743EA4D
MPHAVWLDYWRAKATEILYSELFKERILGDVQERKSASSRTAWFGAGSDVDRASGCVDDGSSFLKLGESIVLHIDTKRAKTERAWLEGMPVVRK